MSVPVNSSPSEPQITEKSSPRKSSPFDENTFPARLRLLCIGPQEPNWISLTLKLDAEGCLEPQFRWVSTSTEAIALLREESFDCILLEHLTLMPDPLTGKSQYQPDLLIRAIRASGCDDPILVLSTSLRDENWIQYCKLDCEVLVSGQTWESQALVTMIEKSMNRVDLLRANHQFEITHHRRLIRERDEADHLLSEQRKILEALGDLVQDERGEHRSADVESPKESHSLQQTKLRHSITIPESVRDFYQELLRTYVIMGSGNLGDEIGELAELICMAGLDPQEALELHLERVETLVNGLGNRSARHVMSRADLLALELMIHLAESYQKRLLLLQVERID